MGKVRRYGRRDANERRIIEALRYNGCGVIQIDEPCDLIVAHIGHTVLMEVKTPGAKLTPAEAEWWGADWPGKREIVHSVHEALLCLYDVEPFRARIGTLTDVGDLVVGQQVQRDMITGCVYWRASVGWRVSLFGSDRVESLTPEWRPL